MSTTKSRGNDVNAFVARSYEPSDESAVLALLRKSLGDGRAFDRTSAFWQWKHFQNPFGPSLMLVTANSEILGLRAFMRWQFRIGPRVITAMRAVDTATHPGYQRQGIFASLTRLTVERAQREGVELIYNTPNNHSLPGYLKLGWQYIGRVPLLIKILRPLRIAATLLGKGRSNPDEMPVPEAPRVGALLGRTTSLDSLLKEDDRFRDSRIRTNCSIGFLQWRYVDVPSLSYYTTWIGGETPTAAVIFRPNLRRGLREILICELLLNSTGVRQVPWLIRGLIDTVEGDYLVAYAPSGSAHWRALLRAGFIPIPRLGPYLTTRPLNPVPTAAASARFSHWHLSVGDLEVF